VLFVCLCARACVCVRACMCVRSQSDHKFTAMNVNRLIFRNDNVYTVIKPKIVKIKSSTIVHATQNQAAHHCMLAFCVRGDVLTATVCFRPVSCDSSSDGDSERYKWNGV
jgi:hypothetical protein